MSRRVAEHAQGVLRHVVQGVGLARRHRIADAGLNVAPPAVIGAAEADEMGAARVVARQPHRLHHRLGAGHVERDFVEAGDLPQPLDVVGDHRMVGAEHRAEIANALGAARDAFLVEVVAEDVDAVRAGQVVEAVAVEVGDGDAGRRLHERAGLQVLAHVAAELERHAVGVGELQVGDAVLDLAPSAARFRRIARGRARTAARSRPRAARQRPPADRRRGRTAARRIRRTAPGRQPGAPSGNGRTASDAWPSTAPSGSSA